MSTLSFLFNCIIMSIGFQEILSMPNLENSNSRDTILRDDYTYTLGVGAHKLHTEPRTWNEARKICMAEGGHLAIINSAAEERTLMDIFNQVGPIKDSSINDEALLGIHDQFVEGEWITLFGDPLEQTGYSKWSDKWGGQPDNGYNASNCGAILKEGGMDDVSCKLPYGFFCELPI
ncbi:hemolymph lipopolysaccharide-binding protein-like [Megachile rotundata]|uniref:hemolymph lipopolysaccharide-binding protein-like n=1 Tax=Megachile rotundata TaxID=143995 RepID=UPI00061500C7|nr:PREDICTED: hemolymph lipopolysaccharide-binding protein-like [Megachile rotundata]